MKKEEMNEEMKSRTGLSTVVIAKCMNSDCGWEARMGEKVEINDFGSIFCPMCGKPMQGEIN